MESIIRGHKVQALKAQLASCQCVCADLVKEFQTPALTDGERAAITHRLSRAREECRFVQLALDLLERQEREKVERVNTGSLVPKL